MLFLAFSTCWNCCFIIPFHSLTICLNSFTSAAKLSMPSGVSCSPGRSDSSSLSSSDDCLDFSPLQKVKKRKKKGMKWHADDGNLTGFLKHLDARTLQCYRVLLLSKIQYTNIQLSVLWPGRWMTARLRVTLFLIKTSLLFVCV